MHSTIDIQANSALGSIYMPKRDYGVLSSSVISNYLQNTQMLRNAANNKGSAFNALERNILHLDGLLPPKYVPMQQQVEKTLALMRSQPTELNKFGFLQSLLHRNERLFFRLVMDNIVECMPIIYTPIIGEACTKWGSTFPHNRGMYISYDRKGRIFETLCNWPNSDVRVIVVTDGERILGLGDLGTNGMGIPIGKLLLYSGIGGVDPHHTLPITLDVGCNTPAIRNDPYYMGLDMDRVRGPGYDEFIDEFVLAVQKRFGMQCLIQFEDFAKQNAARLLAKYQYKACCFNDDIQGTAAVALAGILAALRVPDVLPNIEDHRFVFYGAGSAGIGIANLIVEDLVENKGMKLDEAKRKCWFVDTHGLIFKGRGDLTVEKEQYAHDNPPALKDATLQSAIEAIKPTCIVGVSTIPNSFNPDVVKLMAKLNKRPLIFALSNPTSKAECTAESAYVNSDGRAVFSAGSPFKPVTLPDGRKFHPGQGNNSYIFPGVGLGISLSGARHVSDQMFLAAASTLASLTSEADLAKGCLYPPLTDIQKCSAHIAHASWKQAEKDGLATYPAPATPEDIRKHFYNPSY